MTLFRLTEIYEFAARLGQKRVFDDEVILQAGLHGMLERRLVALQMILELDLYNPVCRIQELPFEKQLSIRDLLAETAELSLDHALWIFERFNWRDVRSSPGTMDILKGEQRKLLERRL